MCWLEDMPDCVWVLDLWCGRPVAAGPEGVGTDDLNLPRGAGPEGVEQVEFH